MNKIKNMIELLENYTNRKVILEAKIPFQSKITYEEQNEIENIKDAKEKLKMLHPRDYPLDDYSFAHTLKVNLSSIKAKFYSSNTKSEIIQILNKRLKQIKDKYKTTEEIEIADNKKLAADNKAWNKRNSAYEEKMAKEEERKNNLTDRQKAINKLVDLQYSIAERKKGKLVNRGGRNEWHFRDAADKAEFNKDIKKLRDQIDALKAEYNIKSVEIKRQ